MEKMQLVHPGKERLAAFVSGALGDKESGEIEVHLAECNLCRDTLEGLPPDTLTSMLRSADTTTASRGGSRPGAGNTPQPGVLSGDATTGDVPAAAGVPKEAYDFLAPPQLLDELGRLGSYRILKVLGTGGMGVVFLAEDLQLKRRVALKAMKPALAASDSARRRFLREAQATAAIDHDHIVTIHQVGEDRGVPFLAMQLLQGEALDDRLKREPRLPLAEVLRIGREIARGLAAAHKRGLIHRDIKPANIWLEASAELETRSAERAGKGSSAFRAPRSEFSRVKIVDFGLARASEGDAHLTATGAIVGTPAYMAPEQARGGSVDYRADLFSLGCVLYRLCTGQVPFKGDSITGTLLALTLEKPAAPSEINADVPPALSDLVMKLLAKKPEDRPESATAVVKALESIEHAGMEQTQTVSDASQKRAPAAPARVSDASLTRRRRTPIFIAAAVLLLAFGLVAYFHGGTIIRVATNKGELIVETDDPNIEVVVKQNGVTIVDRTKDRKFELTAGDGAIEVYEADTGLKLLTKEFKLTRGGQARVTVRQGELAAAKPKAVPGGIKIEPEPLPAFAAHEPLSSLALVTKPATIEGVLSWTIETRGHRCDVRAVAYHPDGGRIATVGNDGTIRIWEADTGRLIRVLVSPAGVTSAAWSPDGKTLACGSDKTVWLWEVDSGRLLRTLPGQGVLRALAWAPDGQMLAGGGHDKTVQLWDAVTGKLLDTLQDSKGSVLSLAWAPDGKTLAAGGVDKTVHLWEVASGNHLRALEGHQGEVRSLAWSPDGKTLASGGSDKTIRLWEPTSGKKATELKGHKQTVSVLAWLPEGILASGAEDGSGVYWNVASNKSQRTFQEMGGSVDAIAWSPDGKTLTSGTRDGTVRIREVKSGQVITIPGHKSISDTWNYSIPPLAISPDGKLLAYGDLNSRVSLWDLATGELVRALPEQAGPIVSVAWSPDGKTLAVGGADNQVRLWEMPGAKLLHTLPDCGGWVSAVAWSPDGKVLATGGQSATVKLWDPGTAKPIRDITGHKSAILGIGWSPDGKQLVSGSYDGTVRVWEAETGKNITTLDKDQTGKPLGEIHAATWSPDGKFLVAAGDSRVWVWEAASGKPVQMLTGHSGWVYSLAWSRDSKVLATGAGDGSLRLWDGPAGKRLNTLTAPPSCQVDSVSLSPDGQIVASSCHNMSLLQQIRLWNTDTGRRLIFVPLANAQGLALSPDGFYRGTAALEKEIVYVVQTNKGQETLTSDEFAKKYQWKNDPRRVRLTGDLPPVQPKAPGGMNP